MAAFQSTFLPPPKPVSPSPHSNFVLPNPASLPSTLSKPSRLNTPTRKLYPSFSIKCSSTSTTSSKIIRSRSLDNHVVKQNKIRFIQKLKTLLLAKPKHYIRLTILSKCRSYLSIPKPRSLLSMIHRYPTIFEFFTIPSSSPYSSYEGQVCIRLTAQAFAIYSQELSLKSTLSNTLAIKLQKLLMLSSHKRILLSKLVHIAPDLGLPPNFRSRLCNDYPNRFKTIETSYGRALELVSWDPNLAAPMPNVVAHARPDLIVDRPLKFKYLRLRKGLNLKRKHREFLIKFGEMPEVNPYCEQTGEMEISSESIEAEKKACAVVREVLGMMVEKRTLVDHLTHFRKEFNLSNKLRGMLVRHPELFYVSLKGQRDSVFLVEGYDDKGKLLQKDELLVVKDRVMQLVREGKKLRRERRKNGGGIVEDEEEETSEEDSEYEDDDLESLVEEDDGLESLFEDDEWEDYGEEDDIVVLDDEAVRKFWSAEACSSDTTNPGSNSVSLKHW